MNANLNATIEVYKLEYSLEDLMLKDKLRINDHNSVRIKIKYVYLVEFSVFVKNKPKNKKIIKASHNSKMFKVKY